MSGFSDRELYDSLADAVASGRVTSREGTHLDRDEACRIVSRRDVYRTLWLPERHETEIVLSLGLEGEGEWLVAFPDDAGWTVVRDYWDRVRDESAEEVLLRAGDRSGAVAYLSGRLLEP